MKRSPLKLYRQMSPAVRTSVWFTLCNFLQRGTAFIVVPIFTRLLTTEEYGICNVYFAWFEILILFTSLKIPYEGLNNGLIRHEEDKNGYTSSMLGLIIVMTLGAGAVYCVFQPLIDQFIGLNSTIMLFMGLQLLFNPPLMLWTNRERFDFRYRWPVVVTLISTVANPLIAVVAVLNTTYRAEARIISSALVQTVFGLLVAILLFGRGKCFYNKRYWKFALHFNLPLMAYYLSQSLLNQSDRIMINFFEGSGKAAIYSVAYSAATLMLLLVSAINGSFNPWMYKKLKGGQHKEVGPMVSALCLLIGSATLALTAFAPDLVAVLATADYSEAVWIIPPVSASVFFVFIYMMFANVEMYYDENNGIALISIISAAANVILNAIFIPIYGYLAAGWTTLVCYVLLAGLHYVLMKRACKRHQVKEAIFPEKLVLGVSAAVVTLSLAMMGMYTLGPLRYLVLGIEAIVIFCLRGKLLRVLKQISKGA